MKPTWEKARSIRLTCTSYSLPTSWRIPLRVKKVGWGPKAAMGNGCGTELRDPKTSSSADFASTGPKEIKKTNSSGT
jgi:hypothetical protein